MAGLSFSLMMTRAYPNPDQNYRDLIPIQEVFYDYLESLLE